MIELKKWLMLLIVLQKIALWHLHIFKKILQNVVLKRSQRSFWEKHEIETRVNNKCWENIFNNEYK
jgi:hypothetical protein